MNAPSFSVAVLLLQWTALLALGWSAHALFRKRHPRWRLILWRSILCFGIALPICHGLQLPRLEVSPPRIVVNSKTFLPPPATNGADPGPHSITTQELGSRREAPSGIEVSAVRPPAPAAFAEKPTEPWRNSSWWLRVFAVIWLAGCVTEIFRLLRVQRELRRLARGATAASAPVQSLAWKIQRDLNVSRPVRVRVSDAISAPFLCGIFKPTILIPRELVETLPAAELGALLSHELAHERRHDLAWCIAWRFMRALCWFHPLAWGIPDAHVLACEEEADRIAAQRDYEGDGYARLLAQLALRILRTPVPASPLALNASSHLARRLVQLGHNRGGAWRPGHSLAGLAVAVGLFALTAGWQFAQTPVVDVPAPAIATATIVVTVQDETGRPVEGATITPNGLRAREERLRGTGYGWVATRHGPAVAATTDHDGNARVTYPIAIVPSEKILTGMINFTADHPAFAKAWITDHPVDGTGKPVSLKRGISLRVAGTFGPDHRRVANIVPHLMGDPLEVRPEDWQREPDGSMAWRRMTPGRHFLHVAGELPNGEIGYSDGVAFFGEQRDAHDLQLELKPGVRVEGRVDSHVARPIKNGWVQLSVHDDEANTQTFPRRAILSRSGNTGFWWSYRPIAADGSFVFESVPAGQLKVIAYGDGFISTNGIVAERPIPAGVRIASQPVRRVSRSIPQSFAAVRPVTTMEIATEATATLKVIANSGNHPVAGAKVHVWPNVIQMPTGSRMFGGNASSSEASFRALPPLPERIYSVITDKNGVAVLRDVPAFTPSLGVEHPDLEAASQQPKGNPDVPARFGPAPNRYIDLTLSPGQTTDIAITLQPKGRQFLGLNP